MYDWSTSDRITPHTLLVLVVVAQGLSMSRVSIMLTEKTE
jgi:hypothetical protein